MNATEEALFTPQVARYAVDVTLKDYVKIRLEPDIAAAVERLCEKKILSKQDLLNRLLRWYVRQDGMLQSLILGHVDEHYRNEIIDLVVEKLRAAGPTVDAPLKTPSGDAGYEPGQPVSPRPAARPKRERRGSVPR